MTKAELYKKACMLPLLPGVYIIRDKTDTIIYIGKAKRLKIRVSQYFREGVPHDAKVTQMINHAFTFDVIVCQSEFEALVLEASQIKAHTPKYNILLKDDKGYSYVKITRGPWPRVSAVLQKDDDDADYIGPFTSSFAVREMVEMAQDCFLLPRCSKEFPRDFGKGRPCLNAHIGKCMAVCSGKITCEAYNDAVQGALRMVRYGKKDIVKQLREKMEAASDRLDFETAALLRDQIQAIERVAAGQKVVMDADTEMDIIALAGTTRAVCAAVLRYRDGRLTDKREFMFHDTTDIDAVREEFLPQYYLNGETVPKTIAVDALPPDAEALNEALAQARGTKVELYVPQRGDVAKLVTMAYTNAVERLGRESGRYTREQKLLEEAAQVLGLKAPPRVIESYDISNWGDGSSVCGMVTFKDGKPFKTRAGGVMRLETLISDIVTYVTDKIRENQTVPEDELDATARCIAIAALKYGDLSNLATKDYIFDLERFAAFEGNTGPYLLYTIVRIKSILNRCGGEGDWAMAPADSESAKALQLELAQMPDALQMAYRDSAPNVICAYAYELAGAVNRFYHETRILAEPDKQKQAGYLALIRLARRALEECIDLLGFSAPDRM